MDPRVIAAREEALVSYISIFVDEVQSRDGVELSIDIEAAANAIAELYARYADEQLRGVISSAIIQNYKIISCLEVAVLRVEPFPLSDDDDLTNAIYTGQLAMHVAISFFLEWNEIDTPKFNQLIERDDQLKEFIDEHINWLATVDSRYYFPSFANSQVWRLFHYLIIDRIAKL